ncbi:iron-sulfur cluster assembly accessory protein [Simiduia sp. 21SJ11W-1]|uniref:HesB/IscA family protein n=1 Tax=Simiduia sp. 21SJ11W-1 TaxID=2909669 RepID=UPI00209CA63C|nr:iron-sulfur cluster assembly accessory protein [Simiduia sp. 21SJ11W-1]UTA49174.1 iron-sulfur cluster assembly accessory protein [Simiduia sp. 21SJ11W-1]
MSSSVSTFDPKAPLVTVTEKAAKHFARKLADSGKPVVRLSIKSSGCTGYAYVLDTVEGTEPGDTLLEVGENVRLAISADAAPVISGTEIDMVIEGVNRVIKYNNPNVVAECGCGESFSVN